MTLLREHLFILKTLVKGSFINDVMHVRGEWIVTFVTLCMKALVKQLFQHGRGGKGINNLQICVMSLMDDFNRCCQGHDQPET